MKHGNITISPVNMDERRNLGIRAGDTVRVTVKVVEKAAAEGKGKKKEEKERVRLQAFEGLVLSVKHGTEAGASFTVRTVLDGVGVERIFPLYSPLIDTIEIVRRARVRRAKLYHIREKAAKEIRKQMKSELHVAHAETLSPVSPEAIIAETTAEPEVEE